MKGAKNMEDPVARKRLRRKVLERWENEGGSICTDPVNTSQSGTPGKRGRRTPARSQDSSADVNDRSSSLSKNAR